MRRVVFYVAAPVLALWAGGCLLTTNLDNIVGVPPVDAAPPDQGNGDASGDDGSDGFDGYAGPWCVTHPGHQLCTDFDEDGGLFGDFWATPYDQNGGASTIDTTYYTSPPNAFLSTIPTGNLARQYAGGVVRNINATVTGFHYAFDVRVATTCFTGLQSVLTIASVAFELGTLNIMGIVLQSGGFTVIDSETGADGGSSAFSYSLSSGPKPDTFQRLEIDLLLGASGHTTVTLDGNKVVDQNTAYQPRQSGSLTLNAGIFGNGPVGACNIDYDNMTFDVADGG